VFPALLDPFIGTQYPTVAIMGGVIVPWIEILIGVGLLFKKTRNIALGGVVAMLLFVLTTIGPFGLGVNVVVWPWNIVFAGFAFILFWRCTDSFVDIVWRRRNALLWLAILLFTVLPLLFFFGKWDGYPSFSLYSGQTATLAVGFTDDVPVPSTFSDFVLPYSDYNVIHINRWAMEDIGVPVYPETRVLRVVGEEVCRQFDYSPSVFITLQPALQWLNKKPSSSYFCPSL
jgi:hypothetical protein